MVGGVTSPLLKTVGGVTDGLPIVSFHFFTYSSPCKHILIFESQVGSGGAGGQQQATQAQPKAQKPKRVLTEAEQKQKALEKKKRAIALKKQQLELEAAELEMDD